MDFNIDEELDKLPKLPGVYLMHDDKDNIIYVGKAKNLFNRVRSYFRAGVPHTAKINKMISLIDHFEYIVVDSELEAFVLENNLIKEHSPKYNTLLKDSKTYPYIRISVADAYPRITMVRRTGRDRAKYYGPYTSMTAVTDIIELLNATYKLRQCSLRLSTGTENDKPCLNYHMGKCNAPCCGKISAQEYRQSVQSAIDFLNGNDKTLINDLRAKMEKASEELNFEEAIKYRELIESASKISERQKITDTDEADRDVIAIFKNDTDAVIQVFFVRDGRMIGREHYHLGELEGESESELLTEFVKRYYTGTPFVPREVMLSHDIDEREIIEEWLSMRKGIKVHLLIPKIGAKEKFVELAIHNAELVLNRDKEKILREERATKGALTELNRLLGCDDIVRIEAFDISNTNGFENVGSMVVFENGRALKSDYRKFKIKTVSGPNDYACMHEVLSRRFIHGFEQQKMLKEAALENEFNGFARFPDLILMDGGRGQVNIAKQVLRELNLDIRVCGMVKDDFHRTRGLYVDGKEIEIDKSGEAFRMITRIQDEAHRFAIEFHKSLRSKAQTKSLLDDIPGIGPARKKALMRSFDSIEDIKNASVEQLSALDEINENTAISIYKYFHPDLG